MEKDLNFCVTKLWMRATFSISAGTAINLQTQQFWREYRRAHLEEPYIFLLQLRRIAARQGLTLSTNVPSAADRATVTDPNLIEVIGIASSSERCGTTNGFGLRQRRQSILTREHLISVINSTTLTGSMCITRFSGTSVENQTCKATIFPASGIIAVAPANSCFKRNSYFQPGSGE